MPTQRREGFPSSRPLFPLNSLQVDWRHEASPSWCFGENGKETFDTEGKGQAADRYFTCGKSSSINSRRNSSLSNSEWVFARDKPQFAMETLSVA